MKRKVDTKNTGFPRATAQAINEDVCERLNCKGHLIILSPSCHIISGFPYKPFLNLIDLGSTLPSKYLERVVLTSVRANIAFFWSFSPLRDKTPLFSHGDNKSVYCFSEEESFISSGLMYQTCASLQEGRGVEGRGEKVVERWQEMTLPMGGNMSLWNSLSTNIHLPLSYTGDSAQFRPIARRSPFQSEIDTSTVARV